MRFQKEGVTESQSLSALGGGRAAKENQATTHQGRCLSNKPGPKF
jgi:hypothetical protein